MPIWRSAFIAALLVCSFALQAEEPAGRAVLAGVVTIPSTDGAPMVEPQGYFNVPFPTFGGRQFWGDTCFLSGWRIQENVFTHHFRLLDPNDMRRAWGSREACQLALKSIRQEQQLPPMRGEAVVLLHGIIRSSKSFSTLTQSLSDHGYTVVYFDYPSTQVPLQESAKYLQQVLQSLEGVERIHFVCHSMGGLVLRSYLQLDQPDPRIGRIVMLGVPNQGAEMATLMQDNYLYQFIYGPAGREMTADPQGVVARLPIPQTEFAIIAGAKGDGGGWNPLVNGDDDGTVTVESTRLPGAADFMTVPVMHSFIMSDTRVQEATVCFLKSGCLKSSGVREPIPAQTRAPR